MKAFAGAGLMTAAAVSVILPVVAIPAAAASAIEIAASLAAGVAAAVWVERREPARVLA